MKFSASFTLQLRQLTSSEMEAMTMPRLMQSEIRACVCHEPLDLPPRLHGEMPRHLQKALGNLLEGRGLARRDKRLTLPDGSWLYGLSKDAWTASQSASCGEVRPVGRAHLGGATFKNARQGGLHSGVCESMVRGILAGT